MSKDYLKYVVENSNMIFIIVALVFAAFLVILYKAIGPSDNGSGSYEKHQGNYTYEHTFNDGNYECLEGPCGKPFHESYVVEWNGKMPFCPHCGSIDVREL